MKYRTRTSIRPDLDAPILDEWSVGESDSGVMSRRLAGGLLVFTDDGNEDADDDAGGGYKGNDACENGMIGEHGHVGVLCNVRMELQK